MGVRDQWNAQPDDHDGAIAHSPVLQWTGTAMQANRIAKAIHAPGGDLNSAKMETLNNQELAACDKLDGLVDGLINNTAACHDDPAPLLRQHRLGPAVPDRPG